MDVNCRNCSHELPAGAKFCPSCGSPVATDHTDPKAKTDPRPQGEYRQVTVLFCDIVDSTRLAEDQDVERLRQILLDYQQLVSDVVEQYQGHISKYMGDGIMAYFGYPTAHEDSPRRAALSALGILKKIADFNKIHASTIPIGISLRIGIHTGNVVAGEMGAGQTREALAIVGLAPNIAARLEKAAAPDTVYISEDTQKLIDKDFSFLDKGYQRLKGIKDPIQVFQLSEKTSKGIHKQSLEAGRDFLVGRDQEIDLLLNSWNAVKRGDGVRIVTITGEPGIGKTGLLRSFLHKANVPISKTIFMTCTPYDQHSAFSPILRMLEDEFNFIAGEKGDTEAHQIKEWIRGNGIRDERTVGALARLFLLDHETEENYNGQAMRQDIFMGLVRFFRSKGSPLLVILEDAHWTDPSTQEFIDRIVRRTVDSPVLMVVLKRPQVDFPWEKIPTAEAIHLTGLDPEACASLIRQTVPDVVMDRNLISHIQSRTDGIPLFIEELTRSIQESDQVEIRNGRMQLSGKVSELHTPTTLMDSLTERLDRLGEAKHLAQTASVYGRSFPYDILALLSDHDDPKIAEQLSDLVESDFVVHVETQASPNYEFRHALYQRVAYTSMLRKDRAQLHGKIVKWAERTQPRHLKPETLAYHCEEAGLSEKSVHYWLMAGERASQASACEEAVRHLTRGLEQLKQLTESDENRYLALRYYVLLGSTLIITDGPGAPRTRETYDRALELCEELPESKWHFPAYWGWWRISENFRVMLGRAERIVEVAKDMEEPEFGLQAHHCNWANSFLVGDHKSVCAHADTGLQIYENGKFGQLGSLYGGHDPKVCGLGELALSKWLTGYPDQAKRYIAQALEWADESGHLGSRLHGLDIAAMLYHYLRDVDAVRTYANDLRILGEKNGLDDYFAKGMIFDGWWQIEEGLVEPGAKLIESGLKIMREVGTAEDFPVYLCMLAECYRSLGNYERSIEMLEEGLNVMKREGVAYWASELNRQYAETLLAMSVEDDAWLEAYLKEAFEIAEKQEAKSLLLRTTQSFAKVLESRGQRELAYLKLNEILDWFVEGADTRDHKEARDYLEQLKN